ncbi:hypothetical protein ANANG_G00311500 [Anguilla anguilla]|uniref:Uncharacterized protein n=1 Tax=Anguilla anguilla TaxID=7936 RepID=A0A9D3RHT5_ANGAN|nr:hypothetical protein ANANG_G00311500 [Anguilla anguilla]
MGSPNMLVLKSLEWNWCRELQVKGLLPSAGKKMALQQSKSGLKSSALLRYDQKYFLYEDF